MKVSSQKARLMVEHPTESGTYIPVAGLTNIPTPSPEREDEDVTDLDSDAKEYIPGLPDFGDLECQGFASKGDAGQALIRADAGAEAPDVRKFRIELPKLEIQFDFEAYAKKFVITAETAKAYRISLTLRTTGAATESALAA